MSGWLAGCMRACVLALLHCHPEWDVQILGPLLWSLDLALWDRAQAQAPMCHPGLRITCCLICHTQNLPGNKRRTEGRMLETKASLEVTTAVLCSEMDDCCKAVNHRARCAAALRHHA